MKLWKSWPIPAVALQVQISLNNFATWKFLVEIPTIQTATSLNPAKKNAKMTKTARTLALTTNLMMTNAKLQTGQIGPLATQLQSAGKALDQDQECANAHQARQAHATKT